MRLLLDTSVLLAADPVGLIESGISVVTIAELEFGARRAQDPAVRAGRVRRLREVKESFDPVPVDPMVARAWGELAALTAARGRKPRARALDLLIAATAQVHGLTLLTRDTDLLWLADVLDVRRG